MVHIRRLLLILALGLVRTASIFAEEAPDLAQLVGAVIDIDLNAGKPLKGVEVLKVVPGAVAGSARAITVKLAGSARQQIVNATTVREIVTAGEPLDITFDKKDRSLVHDAEKRRLRLETRERIERQLREKRSKLWEEIPDQEQTKYADEVKTKAQAAIDKCNLTTQLLETKYFLFYTDMPLNTVGVYVKYLDAMYEQLCKGFDVSEGKNIWRGKCAVIALQNATDFYKIEGALGNPNAQGAQGICHPGNDGTVIITCYKGQTVEFFATVLVHETAHGFVHRYKSTLHVPPWIDEGIADWVAGMVVKADSEVRERQVEAVSRLKQTGSLGGQFFDERIRFEPWQYGVASSMVELLLRIDAKKYRRFFDGVKEGLDPEDSLKQAYSMNFDDLLKRYAQVGGIPALKP